MSYPDVGTRDPAAVLRRVFGFSGFRPLQEQVVRHIIAGGDVLLLMPTGGGKSICYQVPALCRPGTAVVVSPLIALMDDQVAALRQVGVAAGALHSELDAEETGSVTAALVQGRLDLLYVSPERLLGNGMLERLSRIALALFAIDEAHCVSQWGHEFRPEYRALACLPARFPGVPRIALTATADPRTRDDIVHALAMPQAQTFTASFHRPNLSIAALPKTGETAQLLALLARHKGACGIVYCASRAKTERIAGRLRERDLPAIAFHAGLDRLEKRVGLRRFRAGEPIVVVATIAFGMGIDRPDVRFIVHLDMPDSPEAYYQQIGRAGRDGDPAEALLLYGGEDISRARHWLAQSAAPEAQKRIMHERLEAMIGLTESASCRTRALLAWFGEELGKPCGHCDNCRNPLMTFDGTVEAQKVLSAVYRTGQIFGAHYIIAVLRGEQSERAQTNQHDQLRVFGLGRDRSRGFWQSVIRQLLALGALRTEQGEFRSLVLVEERARPILRGAERVMLREERADRPRARGRIVVTTALAGEAAGMFEALRFWRAAEAKAQAIPPYVIFHDSVLREIAALRPEDLSALGQIRGVGVSKLERYGAQVLDILGRSAA